ncbi:DNA repair and recombination protein RadB [Candidatus Woesearchaeota archaeon]|nr:DNA repair and recombination protein RadB [Candidatus Woesearchaeota archaeon]
MKERSEQLITTGTYLDKLLGGGIERGIVTTLYGAPGTGKSNTCMAISANIAIDKKVIFIDTEGGFSPERVKSLVKNEEQMENILVLKPITFEEQAETLEKLSKKELSNIGLIVMDGVASLYRYERDKRSIQEVNQEFAIQLQRLVVIARKNNLPVIITNQVYTDPVTGSFRMVGGDIVPYRSKTMIELLRMNNERIAVLRKHRSLREGRAVRFIIKEKEMPAISELFFEE